ncbi:MAG: DUF2975 domain-containing protein [Candidatus Aminicenantales bacterium]
MAEKMVLGVSPTVKALRIVLITLLILYGLVFISAFTIMLTVSPSLVHRASDAGFRLDLRVLLDFGLAGPVYFFICYCIFRLLGSITRGEPFSPASPRHIRGIAYAVFVLVLIHAVGTALSSTGTDPAVFSWALFSETAIRVLYGSLSTMLLGFGFLVIAKVLETGVKLQQDQDLTV